MKALIESFGPATAPWLFLALFLVASLLLIWRLESMSANGMEGTVLGTLIMPYCSGIGNLAFAFVMGRTGGPGSEVVINSLVNNITNMTLLLGVPTLIWGMRLAQPEKVRKKRVGADVHRNARLSLVLTLTAVLFFTGVTWALARDGRIGFEDGLVLVGLFLFWQWFHIYNVLRHREEQARWSAWTFAFDLVLLGIGAWAVYVSTEWLVGWVMERGQGFVSARHLGWLSGWLMVLPNAILALYYAARRRLDIVYSSQVGDSHICIPLCLGIFALYQPIQVPGFFQLGAAIIVGATLVHLFFVALLGRLPRIIGAGLIAAYGHFLYRGLLE